MSYAFMYFYVHQYDADWVKSEVTASDGSPLSSCPWEGSNTGFKIKSMCVYASVCMRVLGVLYPVPEKMT